jgi:hypothetical protein
MKSQGHLQCQVLMQDKATMQTGMICLSVASAFWFCTRTCPREMDVLSRQSPHQIVAASTRSSQPKSHIRCDEVLADVAARRSATAPAVMPEGLRQWAAERLLRKRADQGKNESLV